jgi:hypothetical protein
VLAYHRTGAKEFLASHLVEHRAGVLQHMELVGDNLS